MTLAVRYVPSRYQFSYPSTDRVQCCLTSGTGQDRRLQRGRVTRNEAPRSQVQQVVYTDSKKIHNAGLLV
jgi:hypothetical protein